MSHKQKTERDELMHRARAFKAIGDSVQDDALLVAGFLELMHPDMSADRKRAIVLDVKLESRRRRGLR